MAKPAYAAHEQLVSPGRRKPEIWRIAAGLVTVVLVAFGLNSALSMMLGAFAPEFWMTQFLDPEAQGTTPLSMLILLGSFAFITIGVALAARHLHGRRVAGLVGPGRLATVQFAKVMRNLVLLGLVLLVLPPWSMGEPLSPNMAPGTWVVLLPLSLFAVFIQASAEEVLFRGYIQQSLAARFRSPFVWMVLPSALFALGHYLPAEAGENAGLVALWSGVFGLLMADLTARAGTLGPAIAVHLYNNVIALLIVSLPGSLSGLALFLAPFSMADTESMRTWLAVDFSMMFVAWLVARLALRR